MNIDQIRYFMEIEKYKSFTVAAQRLHMNQSTVSRQIAELEKELGAELFIRGARQIELTEAGHIFLKEGREVLNRVELLFDKIGHVGSGHSGRLTIGLPVNIFGLTTEFSNLDITEEYPDVEFIYRMMNLEELNTALVCGDVDIGFTYEFAVSEIEEELAYKSIFQKPFVFFTSQKNPLCKQETVSLQDIIAQRLVLIKTDYHPKFLMSIINKVTFDGNHQLLYSRNYENMLIEVAFGGGIGVLPEVIYQAGKINYNIQKLVVENIENEVNYIIAHNKRNKNPLINSFYKSCIRNHVFK